MKNTERMTMKTAILIEINYKGSIERFALDQKEILTDYPRIIEEAGHWPILMPGSYTSTPMVHVYYKPCAVGSEEWNKFFTDMTYGLGKASNKAYVRKDLFKSLWEYVPIETKEKYE